MIVSFLGAVLGGLAGGLLYHLLEYHLTRPRCPKCKGRVFHARNSGLVEVAGEMRVSRRATFVYCAACGTEITLS